MRHQLGLWTRRLGARRRILVATLGIAFTALAAVAYEANALRSLELSTVNTRFAIRGSRPRPRNVVLVEVDSATFGELLLQWPFPRAVDARVIENIAREDPAVIAYDIQLTDPSSCPLSPTGKVVAAGRCPQAKRDEEATLEALDAARGKTVMSTTETNARGETRFLGSEQGSALLGELDARAANTLLPLDPGGVDRRFEYEIGHLKSFAVVSAEIIEKRRLPPKVFGGKSAWIDYYGPAGTFSTVSFGEVYNGHYPRGTFRNKIVAVGATVPSLHDVAPTSTSSLMPGVEVQASAIETLLHGLPLRSLDGALGLLLVVLIGLIVPLVGVRAGPPVTIAVAVGLAIALAVGSQLAFDAGRILPFVYAAGALVLTSVSTLSVQLVTIAFERERVRDLFSRFVPENVVDEVLASADHGLRLGGVQRNGTVMFTDLRGFTSFAEALGPERVIEVLNRYLTEMSDAILDHGGTLVAYMGDGIMAVFGAPIAQHDHADRALATAREMLSERLPRFNAWVSERGLGTGFRMGIGLNSGSVMSGNVGSERRVEYTAVGDTTNSAARIEQLTKGTPYQLMLSGATHEALTDPPGDLVFVEEVELRGRQARTSIWSIAEDTQASPGSDSVDQSASPA